MEKNRGFFYDELKRIIDENPKIHRVLSMLLDHLILSLILLIPIIICLILFSFEESNNIFFFILFIYLNKDFLNAKSPAKRLLGFQVVDKETGRKALEIQCFIRNLTIIFAWPLEVVICYFNPKRRIGDFLANTTVISSEKEN